jgi:Zn-dependent M28 family amino/carboxypeptidase
VEFSPGGCDDGSGVVILLELLSNLINDLTITFTDVHLIVLLTNAEEIGSQGAQAFITNHPWRSNVHRFIYIDAASCNEMANLVRMKPSKVVFYIDLSDLYSFLFFVVVVDYGL